MIAKFRKLSLEDNVSVVEEARARVAYISPSERKRAKNKLRVWRNQLRRQNKGKK